MRQAIHHLTVSTRGKGFIDITREAKRIVAGTGIAIGLATIFCRHTSASLLIQENADPDVRTDLETFFARIAPEGRGLYVHDTEGPDDMPAHIRTALTQSSIGIPVERGRLVLGTWQGIYLFEHRSAPHQRDVVVHVLGE
jgi:secondary thiamine-phosphate synthase enzyme